MRYYSSSPRGMPVDEFVPFIQVFGPDDEPKQEGFNRKLADILTNQVLERRFDMDEILKVVPKANHPLFYEVPCDYGVRMGDQLETAIKRLEEDSDTRRAIVIMARPDDEVPCCIMLIQFLIRGGELVTVAYMRSWDIGLGYAYDVDTFQKLGEYVARELDVPEGSAVVLAGSGHLYKERT